MEQRREELRAGSHEQCKCKHKCKPSASKHMCELPQHKCKRQCKKWKIFNFCARPFAFHSCEKQTKGKRKRKMKNTCSMPLQFMFKPRWCPPLPSLISFPESLFPDCWSRVTWTLGTRLPSSWHTEMHICVSFHLRLHRTCEPALRTLE